MVVNAECNGEQFCGFEVMIMESIALSWYERLPDVHEEPAPTNWGLLWFKASRYQNLSYESESSNLIIMEVKHGGKLSGAHFY